MSKPSTFNSMKHSLSEGTCFGKLDMTHPRVALDASPQRPSRASQRPQFREDQHAKGYDNDVPSGWLRGSGETATNRPYFDHSKTRR